MTTTDPRIDLQAPQVDNQPFATVLEALQNFAAANPSSAAGSGISFLRAAGYSDDNIRNSLEGVSTQPGAFASLVNQELRFLNRTGPIPSGAAATHFPWGLVLLGVGIGVLWLASREE